MSMDVRAFLWIARGAGLQVPRIIVDGCESSDPAALQNFIAGLWFIFEMIGTGSLGVPVTHLPYM
jgi:hypothetical protein